jgi:hypothetical protein
MRRDIEVIIERVQTRNPTIKVHQLKVTHEADDDGIWFFNGDEGVEVQLESSSGMCPFLIETSETSARYDAKTIDEATTILLRLLHLK